MTAVLGRAVEAARVGRYGDALVSLEELGGRESEDPRVLDLLARVHAQRGQFADADACWERAQMLEPSWDGAAEGRRRIAAIQAKRVKLRVLPGVLVVGALAAAGVLLPVAPAPPAPQPPPPPAAIPPGLGEKQDQLSRDLAALRAAIEAPARRVDQVFVELARPEFTLSRRGEQILVTFNDALFSRGTRLENQGRAALAEIGKVAGTITVIGHGSTVDLGLRRAQVAAAALRVPLGTVNLRSAGNTQPPYPAGDRRNNTVTILIDPA